MALDDNERAVLSPIWLGADTARDALKRAKTALRDLERALQTSFGDDPGAQGRSKKALEKAFKEALGRVPRTVRVDLRIRGPVERYKTIADTVVKVSKATNSQGTSLYFMNRVLDVMLEGTQPRAQRAAYKRRVRASVLAYVKADPVFRSASE